METIRTSNVLVEEAAQQLGISIQNMLVTFLRTLQCYRENEDLLERALVQWANPWYDEPSRIPRAFEEYCWNIVRSTDQTEHVTSQTETQVPLREAA
jgi:hypothetical protein